MLITINPEKVAYETIHLLDQYEDYLRRHKREFSGNYIGRDTPYGDVYAMIGYRKAEAQLASLQNCLPELDLVPIARAIRRYEKRKSYETTASIRTVERLVEFFS